MSSKPQKTNAMRMLDKLGIAYETYYYSISEKDFSGEAVAELLGMDPDKCFKTLCAIGANGPVVFVIPVNGTLDMKKAAAAAGEKRIELAHTKDLKALTGYERGGVSPVGLKKPYPVFIDETAQLFEEIEISGGAKGCSIQLGTERLAAAVNARFADITA